MDLKALEGTSDALKTTDKVLDTASALEDTGKATGKIANNADTLADAEKAAESVAGTRKEIPGIVYSEGLFNTGYRSTNVMERGEFLKIKNAFTEHGGLIDQSADATAYLSSSFAVLSI